MLKELTTLELSLKARQQLPLTLSEVLESCQNQKDLRNVSLDSINSEEEVNLVNLENLDITESIISKCFLPGATLRSAYFTKVKFTKCNFAGADFRKSVFKECIFEDCNLQGTNFSKLLN